MTRVRADADSAFFTLCVLEDDQDWESLRLRYARQPQSAANASLDTEQLPSSPSSSDRPLLRCLEVARAGGARTAILETRYIDLDYRSEYSAHYSKAFRSFADTSTRVHFFTSELTPRDVHELPSDPGYLGYMIVRPEVRGVIGRTMLRPPPDIRRSVRTGVLETVHFFGQPLSVRAVPFIQQDAQLGSCAHAAAWMCHYSAFLGGRGVPRRTMAELVAATELGLAPGRLLPTPGLSVEQITGVLARTGLPPTFYNVGAANLRDRPDNWPPRGDAGRNDRDAATKRLCCRYLNSALPILAVVRLAAQSATMSERHAMVICGYIRRSGASDVSFIVNDDRRGPYLRVDNTVEDVDYESGERYAWDAVLVPVPEKLWMAAEAAERAGCTQLLAAARVASIAGFAAASVVESKHAAGELSVRTYAISGTRFKERVRKHYSDPNIVREYSLLRLPRYVWVVEAIDRQTRDENKGSDRDDNAKCVLAEVLFDATASDQQPNILATRLPGILSMPKPDNAAWSMECASEMQISCGQYDP